MRKHDSSLQRIFSTVSLLCVSAILLVACSSSSGDDDDDDQTLTPPTQNSTSVPQVFDGTWRTRCVFIPESLFGMHQIRSYIRNGSDTAYIIEYFDNSACTETRDFTLTLRGTTAVTGEIEDAVFGVTATSVVFTPVSTIEPDNTVAPFNHLVYRISESGLVLGASETTDEITDIPQSLDWVVLYTYQDDPEFPTEQQVFAAQPADSH